MGNVAFLLGEQLNPDGAAGITGGLTVDCLGHTEYLFGIRVTVTGDAATKTHEGELLRGERAMWLSNHRTRIDWMLLWTLALRTQTLGQMKIVLKAPLRMAPIFGWAMQHFLFIFLVRATRLQGAQASADTCAYLL
jgi:1-acyl-sn-glycerol-3-phosphate acyltransferase